MGEKTKEQAGEALLAAIDAYINAVISEQKKAKRYEKQLQQQKCIQENKGIVIPDDAQGPYAKYLREKIDAC